MTNRNKVYATKEAIRDLYALLDIARIDGDDNTEARIENEIEILRGEIRATEEPKA